MSVEEELQDLDLADDLTRLRGPAWVLVSVPSLGGVEWFDVRMEIGPALTEEAVKTLLTKVVEQL